MAALIIFRCPFTGMDVQTPLQRQADGEAPTYEAFNCPACTRVHFINTASGKVTGTK
jgi:hypothetical protein